MTNRDPRPVNVRGRPAMFGWADPSGEGTVTAQFPGCPRLTMSESDALRLAELLTRTVNRNNAWRSRTANAA